MKSMFDGECRRQALSRLKRVDPERRPRWGRMTAQQMVVHLSQQMRHALGDEPVARRKSVLGWPIVRSASIYWLPWPKGRIQAPPEALAGRPTTWEADVAGLEALVERFASRDGQGEWPDHALFGPMSRKDWGVFCYRHFDYHLRQFGK